MKNLYKLNDILNESFIRLPMALIANPKYRELTSDAKILYSLLCNRLRLSQLNNWVNEDNEVYLIYTREQAAETLGVSYRTIIRTFKALIDIGLVCEEKRGKGLANHIYISKTDECDVRETKDFNDKLDEPFKKVMCQNDTPVEVKDVDNANFIESDMPNLHPLMCQNVSSVCDKITYQELPNLHPRKKEIIKKDLSEIENSQSVSLDTILQKCELENLDDDVRNIYQSAIERLYYCESYKINGSILPCDNVRNYLTKLDFDVISSVHHTVCHNTAKIKNKINYIMTMLVNAVCEQNIELYLYRRELNNFGEGDV